MTGILGVGGFVFCSAPNFIYPAGCILMSLWVFHSTISVLLALNRCLNVFHKRLTRIFFSGRKPYFYAVPAFFYAVYFIFFTSSIEFTGLRFSWFFNPHYGYIDDPGQLYHGYAHAVHNTIIIIATVTIYGFFGIILIKNWKKLETANNQTKRQERVFFQVFLICSCTVIAASTYVIMNFNFSPEILSVMSTYMLFAIHSLPPIFYLCLNSSIQQQIFALPARVASTQPAVSVTVL
uniref:Serpentine receptor class gamma n=1 Tax=Panagrellus redivivus TaxID=6233 RepID=A0A7E4VAY2_PANRE